MFPTIHNNTSAVDFRSAHLRSRDSMKLAIGETDYKSFKVEGEKPDFVFEELNIIAIPNTGRRKNNNQCSGKKPAKFNSKK